ncbi:hypothetical protein [Paraburkholderia terrae]
METGSRGHDRLLVLSDVEYVQAFARDAQVLALKPDQQTLCLDMGNTQMVLAFGVDVLHGVITQRTAALSRCNKRVDGRGTIRLYAAFAASTVIAPACHPSKPNVMIAATGSLPAWNSEAKSTIVSVEV